MLLTEITWPRFSESIIKGALNTVLIALKTLSKAAWFMLCSLMRGSGRIGDISFLCHILTHATGLPFSAFLFV